MVKITPNSNKTYTLGTRAKAPGGAGPSTEADDTSPTPGEDSQVTKPTPDAVVRPVSDFKPSGAIGGPPGESAAKSGGLDALRR